MENKKVWQVTNDSWYLRDISGAVKNLENVIYTLELDARTMEPYLSSTGSKFDFNFKIYGLKADLIHQVTHYYKNSVGNLGILLNGIKGTGKTVTAEILANNIGVPIIVIGKKIPGLVEFLSRINTDLVILIDEYEKIFTSDVKYNRNTDEHDEVGDPTLLTIMDGVLNGPFRRTFILTTNETWLNENMLNRPGRIRYKETFEDLDAATIEEIIEDVLIDKKYKEDIISYVKTLKIITVDILKAVITEVNLFDQVPEISCKYLNLEFADKTYEVYNVDSDDTTLLDRDISVGIYQNFLNKIKKQIAGQIVLAGNTYQLDGTYVEDQPIPLKGLYLIEGSKTKPTKKVIFVEKKAVHRSFVF